MNDNTILRIKVPAHLYESVKEQLTLTEAKNKPHYGAGMEVVKEKKMKVPKDGMKKIEEAPKEEIKEENITEAVDPNLIAGIIGILFGSLPLLYATIKDYRAAKTPEEKKAVFSNIANTISKKMTGSMEEKKEMEYEAKDKVEEKKHEEEGE